MSSISNVFYYATFAIFALVSCIYIPLLIHYDKRRQLIPLKAPLFCALGFGLGEIILAMVLIRESYLAIFLGFLPIILVFSLSIVVFSIIWRNIQKKMGYADRDRASNNATDEHDG